MCRAGSARKPRLRLGLSGRVGLVLNVSRTRPSTASEAETEAEGHILFGRDTVSTKWTTQRYSPTALTQSFHIWKSLSPRRYVTVTLLWHGNSDCNGTSGILHENPCLRARLTASDAFLTFATHLTVDKTAGEVLDQGLGRNFVWRYKRELRIHTSENIRYNNLNIQRITIMI